MHWMPDGRVERRKRYQQPHLFLIRSSRESSNAFTNQSTRAAVPWQWVLNNAPESVQSASVLAGRRQSDGAELSRRFAMVTESEVKPKRHALPAAFHLLWSATAMSNIGDGLRLTALPLLAASLTTDPRAIAGVAIAERLPWLVFILPGGAWADRLDRRTLRMRLDVARAMVMAVLVCLIAIDRVSIAAIYLVAALLASGEAVVDSSSIALVPSMVDPDDLERAGARLSSAELVANGVIGPPLGGLLFGLAIGAPFVVDAASFVGAALVLAFLRGSFVAKGSARPTESMRTQIADGFRWFWSRRLLRSLAIISTALGFAGFVGGSVFVLFATESLHLSGSGYGLLLVPSALGGLAGSALAPRLARFPLRFVLSASILASGLATLIIAAISIPVLVAALMAVSAGAVLVWNILTIALRQRVIPDQLLGRVGASYRFLVYAGMPVGALVGGLLANAFGVRAAMTINGATLTTIGLSIPFLLRSASEATAD